VKIKISPALKFTAGLVGVLVFLFAAYRLAFKLAGFLPEPYKPPLLQAQFKFIAGVNNIIDAFYPKTYLHAFTVKDLPEFNLTMSATDIKNIAADVKKSLEVGVHDSETEATQEISFRFASQTYKATISFHGGGANNFIYNKTDYDVKLKDNQAVDNLSKFNLLNSWLHDWITPLLANSLADRLELIHNRQEPVRVKINGKANGIYMFEEKVDDQFLKSRNLAGYIIALKDATRLKHRGNEVALNAHHLSGWDFAIANVEPLATDDPQALYQTDKFFKAMRDRDLKTLVDVIDLDYLARFEAYREVLGIDHDVAGDNLRFYYSSSDQKFYPLVRNEGDLTKLTLSGGTTLKSYNLYDPHLADQYDYPRLFLLLERLPEFRKLKYGYLNQLANDYSQIEADFDQIYAAYADVFIYDTVDEASIREKKRLLRQFRDTIDNNLSLIKQQLEFAQVAISVVNRPGSVTIEIIPDAVVPVSFTMFKLNFVDAPAQDITAAVGQDTIMADFSADFDLLPTTFAYTVPVPAPVSSLSIKAENAVTGAPVTDLYSAIASQP